MTFLLLLLWNKDYLPYTLHCMNSYALTQVWSDAEDTLSVGIMSCGAAELEPCASTVYILPRLDGSRESLGVFLDPFYLPR